MEEDSVKPSVVIGLCVLNNEYGLKYVLENIESIQNSNIFEKVNVVVFYDKSIDKSLEILESYGANLNIKIIIHQGIINPDYRVDNICFARNNILEVIKKNYSDYEYFIMMDSNHYSCVGKIRINELKNILHRKDEWDSISFDKIEGYYDYWALSYDPFIYSIFHFENDNNVIGMMKEDFLKILNNAKLNNKLIQVYSAFNGFAIYKNHKFINCEYSTIIDFNYLPYEIFEKELILTNSKIKKKYKSDCEHRRFHLEAILKNNARIMISPTYIFDKINDNHNCS